MAQIYKAIDRSKFSPTIIFSSTDQDRLKGFFKEQGCSDEDVRTIPVALRDPLGCFVALRKICAELKPDIIHSFFLHSDIISWLTTIFDRRVIRISSVEGKFIWDDVNGVGRFKNAGYRLFNRVVRPFFAKTVAVSLDLKNEVVSTGVLTDKVQVIGVGVPVPDEGLLHVRSSEDVVVGVLSRFSPDKGVDLFIQAARIVADRLPKVRFVVAGAGEELGRLRELAHGLGVEGRLSFPGWVGDAAAFFNDVDIFVMPSRREGCPLALLEAMMHRKACVVFNAPGVNEITYNEKNALVVPCFDINRLADAIVRLSQDPSLRRSLADRARSMAVEEHAVRHELKAWESLYSECIMKKLGNGKN
jgi:glycosyltransferase involved in cell wall biosynthesis